MSPPALSAKTEDLLADNSRLFLLSADADTTFDSLTLTGGRTTDALVKFGGAIRADLADVTLTNSTVSGNSTAGDGARWRRHLGPLIARC